MYRLNPSQEPMNAANGSPETIVLIGPTGAGKSTVGEALARHLGRPFVDSDQVISKHHGPIAALFATLGEPAFRRIEAATIGSLLDSQTSPTVFSVGGGAILDPETRRLFSALTVVWLDTELEYVLPRLLAQPNRPLLRGDVAEKWERYAADRRHLYAELADLKVDARTGGVEELAEQIAEQLITASTPQGRAARNPGPLKR
jgi:shikimate kinase